MLIVHVDIINPCPFFIRRIGTATVEYHWANIGLDSTNQNVKPFGNRRTLHESSRTCKSDPQTVPKLENVRGDETSAPVFAKIAYSNDVRLPTPNVALVVGLSFAGHVRSLRHRWRPSVLVQQIYVPVQLRGWFHPLRAPRNHRRTQKQICSQTTQAESVSDARHLRLRRKSEKKVGSGHVFENFNQGENFEICGI